MIVWHGLLATKISFVLLIKMATTLHCILFTVCLLLVNLALAQYVDSQLKQKALGL